MAKMKGEEFKREGDNIDHPNAKIKKVKVLKESPTKTITPTPASPPLADIPAEPTASYPESNNDEGASQVKENDGEKTKNISGFIFMCNPITKLECYQYRVFGLPSWQKEVVEKIKPGAKLFLYDFGLKLLYGVYMATSVGSLNLEPAAFSGKFPAQVKFNIFKECLPLPESSLRHVIKENYKGSKFNQELSNNQVKKLLSSFRPLFSTSIPLPQTLANVPLSREMHPSEIKNQFKHRAVMKVPYIPEIQYNRTRPLVESHTVPMVNHLHQGYYRTAPPYVENVHPALDRRILPSTSGYHIASSQQPYFPAGVAHAVQEPPYLRYRPIDERTPHAQVTSLERYTPHHLPLQSGREGDSNTSPLVMQTAAPHRHQLPSQQLPLQSGREGDSNPSPLVMQTTAPHHHHLPSQQYQDSGPSYISGSVSSQPYVPEYVPTHVHSGAAGQYPSASVPAYTHSADATGAWQYPSASVPAYTHSADATAAWQYPSAYTHSADATGAGQYPSAYTHSADATGAGQYPSAYTHSADATGAGQYPSAYTHSADASAAGQYPSAYTHSADASAAGQYPCAYTHSADATGAWQYPSASVPSYTHSADATVTAQWPQVVPPPITSYYSYPQ